MGSFAGRRVPSHYRTAAVSPIRSCQGFRRIGGIEDALVEAITTIHAAMTHAAAGDDPWILSAGTADISFAVTRSGTISVGADSELADEVTHTLRFA